MLASEALPAALFVVLLDSTPNNLFNHGFAYWIYGVMGLLAAAFVYVWVPETKRQTLEGIQNLWSRSGGTHPSQRDPPAIKLDADNMPSS
jgi:hypothetical protein